MGRRRTLTGRRERERDRKLHSDMRANVIEYTTNNASMLANSGKSRTSPLWHLFRRISPGLAKCSICGKILSYRSSITNLRRHLLLKHGEAFEKILNQRNLNREPPEEMTVLNLIALVKMHPCLWDTRCASYGNNELQHKAWYSIASKLHPTKDRTEIATQVSKQFDALRNEFFSNSQCFFYDELSFMAPTRDDYEYQIPVVDTELCEIEIKEEIAESTSSRECSTACDGSFQNEQRSTEENANQKLLLRNKEDAFRRQASREERKHQTNSFEDTTECNLQLNNVDDNTLFLLSLVADIKRVPTEFEIDFKAELMSSFEKLVKKYENKN